MSMRNSKTKTIKLFPLFGQFLHHTRTHLQKQCQRGMEFYEFFRPIFLHFPLNCQKYEILYLKRLICISLRFSFAGLRH